MSASRIRGGILTVGTAKTGVVNIDFDDADEFDRTPADDETAGDPVRVKQEGSGRVELLSGTLAKGVQTNDWVVAEKVVTVTAGVEAVTTKTHTFTKVSVNVGGSIVPGQAGRVRGAFTYGVRTES